MTDQKTSPVPNVVNQPLAGHSPVVANKPFNFKDALDRMIEGKKITKLEWENDHYGYINKITAQLHIHREGKTHQWILCEGDILGEDYVIVK
jgi:hypothetical protein